MANVQLGTKAVGSIVKLKVNGEYRDFIIVHQGKPGTMYDASCDGVWLLMKDCYEAKRWHSSMVNDYASSEIHSYLNSTFLGLFDAYIQSQIKQVKLPYRAGASNGTTVTSGANGLSTKIFLLSATEAGFVNKYVPTNEGAKLSYFSGCAVNGADNKRVANLNVSARKWWLRSPYCDSTRYNPDCAIMVYIDGCLDYATCAHEDIGVRPALILPSSLLVSDDGTVNTYTAPTVPASITIPDSVEGGKSITISWSAATDAENNLEGYVVERSVDGGVTWVQVYQGSATTTSNTVPAGSATVIPADADFTVEVTNNANDDAPVWEDCTVEVRNGGNHIFTNESATNGFAFNFRVSAERGPSGQGGFINSVQGGFQ